MTQDVRTFPMEAAPEAGTLDRLRAEFVQYQYRFHQFSDFYAIVARFAWEQAQEAVRAARDSDAMLGTKPEGLSPEGVAARAACGIAQIPDNPKDSA